MAAPQVGDIATLTYLVRDPVTRVMTDATVTATAVQTDTAATAPVTITRTAVGTYVGTFAPSVAGPWRVTFTASGAVTDVGTATVFVAAVTDSLPAWAPTLRRIGAFVPTRTRLVGTDNSYSGTFSASTEPTDEQVMAIIGTACDWVAGRAGIPLVTGAYGVATVAAALWAAHWIELAYPERAGDLTTADALRTDAEEALTNAHDANIALGGGGTADETTLPLPQWQFLAPPRYADRAL